MKYIETASGRRVRPSHVLLMIYRYLSGIYQSGDISALNYIKGYLDGIPASRERRSILTVSGHGIGEAEMWLAGRMRAAHVDTLSFRLVDTQLLQFLHSADADDVVSVFQQFAELAAPYEQLSAWVTDEGLIPYWCRQVQAVSHWFEEGRIQVFSNSPLTIPASRRYDLIYVSHGTRYLSDDAIRKLRGHLQPEGHLAVLTPSASPGQGDGVPACRRFADLEIVREAEADFARRLEERGYVLRPTGLPAVHMGSVAGHRERIQFSVLAPARAVLIGQLILRSLGEHISDRSRLEVLNETAARYCSLHVPVNEELELYLIGAESCRPQTSSGSSIRSPRPAHEPATTG